MNRKYEVRIEARVRRELRGTAKRDQTRIIAAIECLAENPRPASAVRLVGKPGWRLRIGNYRILYEVDDARRLVTVYRAGHRSDVYRSRD